MSAPSNGRGASGLVCLSHAQHERLCRHGLLVLLLGHWSCSTAGHETRPSMKCDMLPPADLEQPGSRFRQLPSGGDPLQNEYVQLMQYLERAATVRLRDFKNWGVGTPRKRRASRDTGWLQHSLKAMASDWAQDGPIQTIANFVGFKDTSEDGWDVKGPLLRAFLHASQARSGAPSSIRHLFIPLPVQLIPDYWYLRSDLQSGEDDGPGTSPTAPKDWNELLVIPPLDEIGLLVARGGRRAPGWARSWSGEAAPLQELKVLDVTIKGPASQVDLPEGPPSHSNFPTLLSLRVRLQGSSDPKNDGAALRRFFGNAGHVGGLEVFSDEDFKKSSPPLGADYIEFVCSFLGLKYLRINLPILGLPSCLGQLTKLQVLIIGAEHEFRGPQALPMELENLQDLREFVAFKEGRDECPPKTEPRRAECRASFQSGWRCPSLFWNVRFDDESMPWWKWRKLAIFWVDSNWFHGSIPAFLPERWPELRKFDVYDNNLEGPLPATLGRLPRLGWTQLNHNNFSGEVPQELFAPPRVEVNLVNNPSLRGCVPQAGKLLEGVPMGVIASKGSLHSCRHGSQTRDTQEL